MKIRFISLVGLAAAAGLSAGCQEAGVECGASTCDVNAYCAADLTTGAAACVCDVGFAGDGLTCEEAFAPQTCAEVKAQNPSATDGSTQLFINGDLDRPWSAYCHGMNLPTGPVEYLELKKVGGEFNYSQFAESFDADDDGVVEADEVHTLRTWYHRVRIDPRTLVVDIADQTFLWPAPEGAELSVTSEMIDDDNPIAITSMPFGVAFYCGPPVGVVEEARASIDLTGTPFRLASPLCAPAPIEDVNDNLDGAGQAAELSVGGAIGDCGWAMVDPCPFGVVNAEDKGASMQLEYMVAGAAPAL